MTAPTTPAPREADPFWNVTNLAATVGGRWVGNPARSAPLTGVCTDSRAATPGCVFFALRGEKHDGHEHAAAAVKAGAAAVVASRPIGPVGVPVLIVEETRRALGRFAAAYRDELGAQGALVIAVCGSNGKTTTVRLIDAVLRSTFPGTASQKSFNNDVGVPLTILSARAGDHFVVCEVGTNHPGEIDRLGAIVRPDIAVVTSIGREHLEGFGDLAGVMREEGAIARHLRPNGTLLSAETAPLPDGRTFEGLLETFSNPFSHRCLDRAYWLRRVQPVAVGGVPGVAWKDLNGNAWQAPLAGEHNASNAMLAVWVGQAMGIENDAIAGALLTAKGPEMRQQIVPAGQVTVVNDAYNANPDSMLASLDAFPQVAPSAQRRVAVLGQMGELGDAAPAAHAEVLAAALGRQGVGAVIVVGPCFAAAAADAPPGALLAVEPLMSPEAAHRIAAYIKPGDAVLVKGSRAQAMERVVDAIVTRFAPSRRPGVTSVPTGGGRTAP